MEARENNIYINFFFSLFRYVSFSLSIKKRKRKHQAFYFVNKGQKEEKRK